MSHVTDTRRNAGFLLCRREVRAPPDAKELTAARIVADVAPMERFKSEAAFARYVGLAPIPHTSGTADVRLRPTKQGNRQLNKAIHRIAIAQIAHGGPGKEYLQRRLAEGDTRHRALRSLKRRLARVVFTRLCRDTGTVKTK